MDFDFTKKMQEATDADLLRIVTIDRENYQEAAIIAAESELVKRNLSQEQVDSAKSINKQQQEDKELKANILLDTHWKVLTFIFPGILQIILSGTFKAEGYDRKSNELVKWTLYGFLFYAIIILLAILI